jgi:hypothetical protein
MDSRLSVREVETIPDEASVHDFDQLNADTQQYVVELTRGETRVEPPDDVATALASCDLVKYIGYLRVQVTEISGSSRC